MSKEIMKAYKHSIRMYLCIKNDVKEYKGKKTDKEYISKLQSQAQAEGICYGLKLGLMILN